MEVISSHAFRTRGCWRKRRGVDSATSDGENPLALRHVSFDLDPCSAGVAAAVTGNRSHIGTRRQLLTAVERRDGQMMIACRRWRCTMLGIPVEAIQEDDAEATFLVQRHMELASFESQSLVPKRMENQPQEKSGDWGNTAMTAANLRTATGIARQVSTPPERSKLSQFAWLMGAAAIRFPWSFDRVREHEFLRRLKMLHVIADTLAVIASSASLVVRVILERTTTFHLHEEVYFFFVLAPVVAAMSLLLIRQRTQSAALDAFILSVWTSVVMLTAIAGDRCNTAIGYGGELSVFVAVLMFWMLVPRGATLWNLATMATSPMVVLVVNEYDRIGVSLIAMALFFLCYAAVGFVQYESEARLEFLYQEAFQRMQSANIGERMILARLAYDAVGQLPGTMRDVMDALQADTAAGKVDSSPPLPGHLVSSDPPPLLPSLSPLPQSPSFTGRVVDGSTHTEPPAVGLDPPTRPLSTRTMWNVASLMRPPALLCTADVRNSVVMVLRLSMELGALASCDQNDPSSSAATTDPSSDHPLLQGDLASGPIRDRSGGPSLSPAATTKKQPPQEKATEEPIISRRKPPCRGASMSDGELSLRCLVRKAKTVSMLSSVIRQLLEHTPSLMLCEASDDEWLICSKHPKDLGAAAAARDAEFLCQHEAIVAENEKKAPSAVATDASALETWKTGQFFSHPRLELVRACPVTNPLRHVGEAWLFASRLQWLLEQQTTWFTSSSSTASAAAVEGNNDNGRRFQDHAAAAPRFQMPTAEGMPQRSSTTPNSAPGLLSEGNGMASTDAQRVAVCPQQGIRRPESPLLSTFASLQSAALDGSASVTLSTDAESRSLAPAGHCTSSASFSPQHRMPRFRLAIALHVASATSPVRTVFLATQTNSNEQEGRRRGPAQNDNDNDDDDGSICCRRVHRCTLGADVDLCRRVSQDGTILCGPPRGGLLSDPGRNKETTSPGAAAGVFSVATKAFCTRLSHLWDHLGISPWCAAHVCAMESVREALIAGANPTAEERLPPPPPPPRTLLVSSSSSCQQQPPPPSPVFAAVLSGGSAVALSSLMTPAMLPTAAPHLSSEPESLVSSCSSQLYHLESLGGGVNASSGGHFTPTMRVASVPPYAHQFLPSSIDAGVPVAPSPRDGTSTSLLLSSPSHHRKRSVSCSSVSFSSGHYQGGSGSSASLAAHAGGVAGGQLQQLPPASMVRAGGGGHPPPQQQGSSGQITRKRSLTGGGPNHPRAVAVAATVGSSPPPDRRHASPMALTLLTAGRSAVSSSSLLPEMSPVTKGVRGGAAQLGGGPYGSLLLFPATAPIYVKRGPWWSNSPPPLSSSVSGGGASPGGSRTATPHHHLPALVVHCAVGVTLADLYLSIMASAAGHEAASSSSSSLPAPAAAAFRSHRPSWSPTASDSARDRVDDPDRELESRSSGAAPWRLRSPSSHAESAAAPAA